MKRTIEHAIISESNAFHSCAIDGVQQKVGIKSGKKICCCCPETKKIRDECVVFKGEEHADCVVAIEAHKMCLRAEGFDVK